MFIHFNILYRGRAESGWPPKEIRERDEKRYNVLHYMNDKNIFCIFCWVDNNVVKFVSNVHRGTKEESVEKSRRHPRINPLNKDGVLEV